MAYKHLRHILIAKQYQKKEQYPNDTMSSLDKMRRSTQKVRCQFTFQHGKRIRLHSYKQEQIKDDEYELKLDSSSPDLYYFIIDASNAILQLQKLNIFQADLKLRNFISFQDIEKDRIMSKMIDFGQVLVFGQEEEDDFRQIRRSSSKYASHIKRNSSLVEKQIENMKHNDEQMYNFYKRQYKNQHSYQLLQMINDLLSNKPKQITSSIIKLIQSQSYRDLITYCEEIIQQIDRNRYSHIVNSTQIQQFGQGRDQQNEYNIQSSTFLWLKPQFKNKQIQPYELSFSNTMQSQFYHCSNNQRNFSQNNRNNNYEEEIIKEIQSQNNKQIKLCPECKNVEQKRLNELHFIPQQQKKQLQKVCLLQSCFVTRKCLFCPCKQIQKTTNKQPQEHKLVDLSHLCKNNINQQLLKTFKSDKYLTLNENLKNFRLDFDKLQRHFAQIMNQILSQIDSLTYQFDMSLKLSQILQKYPTSEVYKLSSLEAILRCSSRDNFEQFLQYASEKLEQYQRSITHLFKQKTLRLNSDFLEGLKFDSNNSHVKMHLDQAYRTVHNIQTAQSQQAKFHDQNEMKSKKICYQPILQIADINLKRIQNLVIVGEKDFTQRIKNQFRHKVEQQRLQREKSLNKDKITGLNSIIDEVYDQKIKSMRNLYVKELTPCKTLNFIGQKNFECLKTLNLKLTQDSWPHPKYQFSAIQLLHLINKTRLLTHIKIRGVKIVYFQEALQKNYTNKLKNNQKQSNKNKDLQIDIDADILFNIKFSSICMKKQHLFYFLKDVKALKSINLIYQLKFSEINEYFFLSVITQQQLMDINIMIHSFKAIKQQQSIRFLEILLKMIELNGKISGITLQKIELFFSEDKNAITTSDNIIQVMKRIREVFSLKRKQLLTIVDCKNLPMIYSNHSQIANLQIDNSQININHNQEDVNNQEQNILFEKMQSLWLSKHDNFLKNKFSNLKYLKIHLTKQLINLCQKGSILLPNLGTLITQVEKKVNVLDQKLSFPNRLLTNMPKLRILYIKEIDLSFNFLQFLQSPSLETLSITGSLIIETKQDFSVLIQLFKQKISLICQLSIKNIVINAKQLATDLFFQTLKTFFKLQQLIIDKSIITYKQQLQEILQLGVYIQIIDKQKDNYAHMQEIGLIKNQS